MKVKDDKNTKRYNQYSHLKRPNIPLTVDEHKKIARFCIENEMKIGDFLRRAANYCVENGITF